MTFPTSILHVDVPVDPDAPTARQWVLQELTNPEYDSRPSLLERLIEWLNTHSLSGVGGPGTGWLSLVIVVAVIALVVVALLLVGPIRLRSRAKGSARLQDLDDHRKAKELRASAEAAAAVGDWSTAVVERFRAVVRGLEERTIIDERPGRTADEAAATAGKQLPDLATGLRSGAFVFDGVSYGTEQAGAHDYAKMRELDEQAQGARRSTDTLQGEPVTARTSGWEQS